MANQDSAKERPAVWVGHTLMAANDVSATTEFMVRIGMRSVLAKDDLGILELRGGTHLIVQKADPAIVPGTAGPFDLMVDDVDATYKAWQGLGLELSEVARGKIHDSFTVRAPSGHDFTVNSTHVIGAV